MPQLIISAYYHSTYFLPILIISDHKFYIVCTKNNLPDFLVLFLVYS